MPRPVCSRPRATLAATPCPKLGKAGDIAATRWSSAIAQLPHKSRPGAPAEDYTALFERLVELGYTKGDTLEVDVTADLMPHRLSDGFSAAVRHGANILFTTGNDVSLLAAQVPAAGRIPIVFIAMD